MKFEFYEAELHGIGRSTSTGKGMAAKLHLAYMDTDDRLINHLNLDIFVPRGQDLTLAEMQKAARESAIALLQATLRTLENSDIVTLEKKNK